MTDITPEFNPETAPPRLEIDWDAYLPFFDDEDISEEHKRELIDALWTIMVNFVDLGFGIHPVQQDCGKGVSLVTMQQEAVLNLKERRQTNQKYMAAQFDAAAGKEPQ